VRVSDQVFGDDRSVRVTQFNGIATFAGESVEYQFDVELTMREAARRQLSGRLVGVSRETILGLGPVLACMVPVLFDQPIRCAVHVDGSFESLEKDRTQPPI